MGEEPSSGYFYRYDRTGQRFMLRSRSSTAALNSFRRSSTDPSAPRRATILPQPPQTIGLFSFRCSAVTWSGTLQSGQHIVVTGWPPGSIFRIADVDGIIFPYAVSYRSNPIKPD